MIWEPCQNLPVLSDYNDILIVYGTGRQPDFLRLPEILSPQELDFAKRLRSETQRNTWIAGHVMLRSILGGFAGIEPVDVNIQKNRFGKPFLTNSKLSFNLSHTNEAFLIGFSKNGRIGIDLEKLSGREELLSLIEYSFSQQESDYCLKGELSICFLEIWTLKEAFLKAAGVGLVDNLKSVNVFGEVANDITRRDLCYSNFLCPNGETASVVYRSGASISFVRADHSEY